MWDAVRKTDVRTIAFVKSLSITYPIADDGRLMLSAENVSASGVGGFRLGGGAGYVASNSRPQCKD